MVSDVDLMAGAAPGRQSVCTRGISSQAVRIAHRSGRRPGRTCFRAEIAYRRIIA